MNAPQILLHGHFGENAPALGNVGYAQLHNFVGSGSADLLVHEIHLSALRLQKAGDRFQNGGFSGAVCADQGDDLALFYIKAHALDRVDRAVVNIQVLYAEHHFAAPPFFPR